MKLLPCGDRAILVDLADATERRRLDAALHTSPLPGVVDHVPGATTVLVRIESPATCRPLRIGCGRSTSPPTSARPMDR